MSTLQAALGLAARGIPVFPCKADKSPACANGFKDASTDPATVRRLFADGAALIGVPTGAASGIDALDLDPGSEVWRDTHIDSIPTTTVHMTRRGGWHILFKHAEGLRLSAGGIAPGVEVRADGGHIIWWPGTYTLDDFGLAEWPPAILAMARAGRATLATEPRNLAAIAPPDAAAAVAVLAAMPNPAGATRDTYMAVMLAAAGCYHAADCDESIADAAIAWAERWLHCATDEREKWERDWLTRTDALAGWPSLLREARGLGVDTSRWQATEFSPLPAERVRGLHLLSPAECAQAKRRGYIIKHLAAPGDVGAIIGQPSCGKSILAPHLAYAVAQGRSVFGQRTKQGRVLYVSAEDASGMRQRIDALMRKHGDAPDFRFTECGNLLEPAHAAALLSAVRDWQPVLAVIDTVGAAFAGMDENSAQDMGNVVSLARKLAGHGCAVLLLHHIAKQGDGSPRGHGVLNGTLDVSLTLAMGDDRIVRGKLLKNRNGTTDRQIAFRFDAAPLGQDEDGDPITAPIAVELADDRPAEGRKLSAVANKALALLGTLGGSVPEVDWRARCDDERALSTSDTPKSRDRAFQRAYGELRDAGIVASGDGHVRIVSEFGDLSPEESATGWRQLENG